MKSHGLIGRMTPPLLWQAARRVAGRSLVFSGSPKSWSEATGMSEGYAAELILDRVARATREVIAGRAAFERDSLLFNKPSLPLQLLAPLLRCALDNQGHLEVIDFGGSLGSTYRQSRPFLGNLASLRWNVVEQASFVAAGRAEFASTELAFHASVKDVPTTDVSPMLLASAVLHYLEDPYEVLAELMQTRARLMVIDRTPMSMHDHDRLCIQRVPRHIYLASYPCWIFSQRRLLAHLLPDWRLLTEFPSLDGHYSAAGGLHFEFKGLLLERVN